MQRSSTTQQRLSGGFKQAYYLRRHMQSSTGSHQTWMDCKHRHCQKQKMHLHRWADRQKKMANQANVKFRRVLDMVQAVTLALEGGPRTFWRMGITRTDNRLSGCVEMVTFTQALLCCANNMSINHIYPNQTHTYSFSISVYK